MPAHTPPSMADIWLIRHAPARDGGAMAGRRDVAADCSNTAAMAAVAAHVALAAQDTLITSPAQRCTQTALALFHRPAQPDPRLWEQDFGAWEGRPHGQLPDLGPLSLPELASFAPPQGESFAAVAARVQPVLLGLGAGRHSVVAHAGVIRAALGLALGAAHLGLGFVIAPLSVTRLSRDITTGQWAILGVNWTPTLGGHAP